MPAIIAQTIDLSQWTPGEDGKVRGKDKPGNLGGGPQIVFGDFETAIYQVQPSETLAQYRDLWNQYPYGELDAPHVDNGTLDFDTANYADGARSLRLTMSSDANEDGMPHSPYLQFYAKAGGVWRHLHTMVDDYLTLGPWQFGTYNRMDFYVKTPASLTMRTNGTHNGSFGTYYAADGTLTSSNAGNHPYHRFNIPGGMWVKMQFDEHPDHLVGANGGMEHPDWNDPSNTWKTADAGWTYYDALTRFYFDIEATNMSENGTVWNFDAFRVWQQTEAEQEDKVRSVCLGMRASDNLAVLTWRRNKNDNELDHEVYYSFFNPHTIGIENCIFLGAVSPLGYQGYNGMTFQTNGINWTGQSKIYFAIRPVGETLFKTISYDLAMAG